MAGIEQAQQKLDAALGRLEDNLERVFERVGDPELVRRETQALVADRARLAEELDESMARERDLQKLADEAAEALGEAIKEVRAALDQEG